MRPPSIWAHLRDILILPGMVCVVIPYVIYNAHSTLIPHYWPIRAAGALLFIAGLVLWAYPVFLFRTIGMGTLAPWAPTQKLIITGPYLYCRNPMITGIVFILAGEGLFFWSPGILIWAVWFVVMNTFYFRFSEEPGLIKRFGEDYIRYRQSVPMWLPRFTPYKRGE